jgi:hypothetical protein
VSRFDTGQTDVPSAGTAVQISNTSDRVRWIRFKAIPGNTGSGFVGKSDVSATNGFTLEKDDDIGLAFDFKEGSVPFSDFWVDAANNGDDVEWAVILD